ncbi:MAG: hypothetical protein AAGJ32_12165 [Pseudomonadota bacterium]
MLKRTGLALAIAATLSFASCSDTADTTPDVASVPPQQTDETTTDRGGDKAVVPAQGAASATGAGRQTVSRDQATIDWDKARRDLASRDRSGDVATFQIESDGEAPPVPVLLPSGIVRPANAERPRYRALDDGYFAKYPGVDYDIVISGTNEWYSGGSDDRAAPPSDMAFNRTMTGAQIALNRYGAAYLVEFECNRTAGAMANSCIAEEDALQIAENLVITGSR